MTHRTIATLAAGAMAVGCVALFSDTAAAAPSTSDLPVAAANEPDWVAPYWDMYGLISEGSMWNPDAFSNLGEEKKTEAMRIEMNVVEVSEPKEPTADNEVPVFIDPTISAACGLEEPQVTFDFDSAELKDDAAGTLSRLSTCLQQYPLSDEYLQITGHADPRGTEEYNRELGLDRADSVGEALEQRGVEDARIDTYSEGEEGASDDPEEWPEDRRVEIRLDR